MVLGENNIKRIVSKDRTVLGLLTGIVNYLSYIFSKNKSNSCLTGMIYIYFYALYCIFELETNSAKSIFEFNKLVLMEKTWRWFGKKDPITLDMLRQIGVEGIVTSLYEVQPGEVWDTQTIHDLKDFIESSGLRWSVVESLPVSESIKYGGIDLIRKCGTIKSGKLRKES